MRLPEHREIVGNWNSLLPQWQPSLGNTLSQDLQRIDGVNQVFPMRGGKITGLAIMTHAPSQPFSASARSRSSSADRFSTRVAMYQTLP